MIVSLLLLLVMTVLALAASQATRMQERMAGNARDHDLAFQSSEAGLRAGERLVSALTIAPSPCASGRCQVYELGVPEATVATPLAYRDQAWWDANAMVYSTASAMRSTDANFVLARREPNFFIEEVEDVPDYLSKSTSGPTPSRTFYRITSRGVGGTETTQVVTQSTYARRF